MDLSSMTREQLEALPIAEAQKALTACVKAGRPDLPAALTLSTSKAHAKLAKKALYQLHSLGITAEPPSVETPTTSAAPEVPGRQLQAVLSLLLGTGERAAFFAAPVRGGGIETFTGVIHDEWGLTQFGSQQGNRSDYRKRLREFERTRDSGLMVVDHERLKLELGRALSLSRRAKIDLDTDILQALERLEVTPQDPDFPIPPLEPEDEATREDGAALHDLGGISEWAPADAELATLSTSLDALKLVPIPPAELALRQETVAKQLANDAFTPKVRVLYARRLWSSAELFDYHEFKAEAARLRAEARRLMHLAAPSRFAEQLFVKVLPKPTP
jgi:hypothetical protein